MADCELLFEEILQVWFMSSTAPLSFTILDPDPKVPKSVMTNVDPDVLLGGDIVPPFGMGGL